MILISIQDGLKSVICVDVFTARADSACSAAVSSHYNPQIIHSRLISSSYYKQQQLPWIDQTGSVMLSRACLRVHHNWQTQQHVPGTDDAKSLNPRCKRPSLWRDRISSWPRFRFLNPALWRQIDKSRPRLTWPRDLAPNVAASPAQTAGFSRCAQSGTHTQEALTESADSERGKFATVLNLLSLQGNLFIDQAPLGTGSKRG